MENMSIVQQGCLAIPTIFFFLSLWRFISAAFKVSVWWGLGVLLVPGVVLIFLWRHWHVCGNHMINVFISIGLFWLVLIAYEPLARVISAWEASWDGII